MRLDPPQLSICHRYFSMHNTLELPSPPSSSHHQDNYIFSRECLLTFFATGTGTGVRFYIYD